MNVIVVDTSSWISYFKGVPHDDVDQGLKESRVYLTPIVAAELLSTNLRGSERKALEEFLKELPLCECPFEHWMRVGELRSQLSKQGLAISTPDAHIAQCVLDLKGYLLSEDLIFGKIASLQPLRLLPK